MSTRTTRRVVTFARPFELSVIEGMQPAGAYTVETEEELLQDVSFPAHRRTATVLHLQAAPGSAALAHSVMVDPAELEAALNAPHD